MKGMGKEKRYFPLLNSVKRQKVPLGQSISTNFVADCCLAQVFGPNSRVCFRNPTGLHIFKFVSGIILIATIDYREPK